MCWASIVKKTVRIVQNPSLECYMSTRFKQGSAKHRSGSMSRRKGKAILPNNESLHSRHVTHVLGKCLGVEFDGDTYLPVAVTV